MSETQFAISIGCCFLFGFGSAEIWHRISIRRYNRIRSRESLIAEFVEKQLWQFVSLDEWLKGNKQP